VVPQAIEPAPGQDGVQLVHELEHVPGLTQMFDPPQSAFELHAGVLQYLEPTSPQQRSPDAQQLDSHTDPEPWCFEQV
jgi:hypothetical protein